MSEAVQRGFEAIALGDSGRLKQLLAAGLSADATNDKGLTLLLLASATGQIGLVNLLVDAGASVQLSDPRGLTPLMYAAAKGHEDVVRSLLERKADPNFASSTGLTPLMFAAAGDHSITARRLLDAGALPDLVDHQGCTALHFAAHAGHTACVRRILAYGANQQMRDANGDTPASLAASAGFRDTTAALGGSVSAPKETRNQSSLGMTEVTRAVTDETARTLEAFEQVVAQMPPFAPADLGSLASQSKHLRGPKTADHQIDRTQDLNLIALASQEAARKAIGQVTAVARLSRERATRDLPRLDIALNAAYVGGPGTGKTSFAHHYAKTLHQLGVLSKGHVVKVGRHDIVAEFKGQTPEKTAAAFERAKGGVLFLENAQEVCTGDSDAPGRECVDVLAKILDRRDLDSILVIAGPAREIRDFLQRHPILKRHVPHVIPFADLTPEDLGKLLETRASMARLKLSPEAEAEALRRLAISRKGRSFSNAREVETLLSSALAQQSSRLAQRELNKISEDELCTLIYSDFTEDPGDNLTSPSTPADATGDEAIARALLRLESLVGLSDVKSEVRDVTNFLRVQKARLAGRHADLTTHMIFAGNPGTGKTTVARLLGDIFREIGLLPSGHLVETDRAGLVGGYVGQTALKTKERLEEAVGGVLFIDEAYTLYRGGGQDDGFGREAIETILKFMEDNRGSLVVVLAGYTGEMRTFLEANPGLKSRFGKFILFADYTSDELRKIAEFMLAANGFKISNAAMEKVLSITEIRRTQERHFANAREVRNLLEAAYKRHASRILKLGAPESLPAEVISTLDVADIDP